MTTFNVVVRLEIEQDNGLTNDDLELVLRGETDADSAAAAMQKVSAGLGAKVAEKLGR